MTDAEIDALAREILTKVVRYLEDKLSGLPVISEIHEGDDGELIPVYEATSKEGYGSFICTYMPLDAVRTIIAECERLHDEFCVEIYDKQTNKPLTTFALAESEPPDSRAVSIRTMAENATLNLVGTFAYRLWDALEDGVYDGLVIAKSSLAAVVTQFLKQKGVIDQDADARSYIEEAVKRAADKKRKQLLDHIDGLPNLMAKRGKGALPKSESQKRRDRDTYIARIKEVYKEIRLRETEKPTKTRIATELRAGGINPKKGSDTRLNAFGNKLRKLEIDYDAVINEVEAELHE